MTGARALLAATVLACVVAFLLLSPGRILGGVCATHGLLSLACFDAQRAGLDAWVAGHPLAAAGAYFGVYVIAAALSLPGATIMTLIGGALFGWLEGVLLVSFASTIGATGAFLIARFVLRDWVRRRWAGRLDTLERGIARDGAFYLFALRLVPAIPFFVINLAMAVTPIRMRTFYWVSQLGMLPATLVYVNAGTRLGALEKTSGLMSPVLLGSLALLGVLPLAARRAIALLRRRRALAGYRRPASFDRNLIVIGGGAAGLVAALVAATVRARVTLVEAGDMGGDCLNTGCVPSKALLRSARAAHEMRRADRFGVAPVEPRVEFGAVMARVRAVVGTIAPKDSIARFTALGVDVRHARARLIDPWTVELDDGQRLTARAIVLATGAVPYMPPIPGLADAAPLTSDTIWTLDTLPARLAIIGAGPVACELGQALARLGAQVSLVAPSAHVLPREDADIAAPLAEAMREEGVALYLKTRVVSVAPVAAGWRLIGQCGDQSRVIEADRILVAAGRRARTEDMGLEALGIARDGRIDVDARLATAIPTVYACGDAIEGPRLTHAAAHEAWHAAINALFGSFKTFAVDYRHMPQSIYTEPNVARAGHNERSARAAGLAYEVTVYPLAEHDRAVAEGAPGGHVKLLTVPGRDRLLGASIVGEGAAEWIGELGLALRHRLGLNRILSTVHAYPTFAEANRFAAGEWRKAHAPGWLWPWLARFHAWRRRSLRSIWR